MISGSNRLCCLVRKEIRREPSPIVFLISVMLLTILLLGRSQFPSVQALSTNLSLKSDTIMVAVAVPTVQFSVATYSVNENGGSATIQVTLSAATATAVHVNYATSNGTASAGSDYIATNGALTFNPGETLKNFTVPIVNDSTTEGNEIISLALSNPVSTNLGTPNIATLIIIDDEGPVSVQFNPPSYYVKENNASGKAVINVTLNHSSLDPVTVDYVTIDDTAVAGQDYTAASGTLTFNPGQSTKSFDVLITNDNLVEQDEALNLVLSNPIGGALLGVPGNEATITMIDDDASPVNRPPVANNQNVTTAQNTPKSITLTASDV